MEDVRSRRIVNDNNFLEFSAKTTQIFYVVPSMEDAWFPEEARSEDAPLIQ